MVLLKSVFTHMLPDDVRTYLREVSRVLRTGGRAVITYFLLNDESEHFIARGLDEIKMHVPYQGDAGCRLLDAEVPEQAVAHDEKRIRRFYADVGLSPCELTLGNWCGRPALIGLQDLIIAIKT